MKIRVPGYTLFFIGLVLLFAVITHAADSDESRLIAGGRRLSETETRFYLKHAVQFSRYKPAGRELPAIFLVPDELFAKELCRTIPENCGIYGTTDILYPYVIFVRDRPPSLAHTVAATTVHEVVHWLQMTSGNWPWVQEDCAARSAHEAEAHEVAYIFATVVEHKDIPFEVPDSWILCKMSEITRNRAEPVGVIGPPVITKH